MANGIKHVLSFGAGVQSTTLFLMSCEGMLPRLDHIIFADTQWEPSAVYRHLEWCQQHASKHGMKIDIRTVGNLRNDLISFWGPLRKSFDGKRYASIPAFIKNPDGSQGIVRRQCTKEYKIIPIERYVREECLGLVKWGRWPKHHVITQWIGISADEAQRMKRSTRPAIQYWHPLIEADACQIHEAKTLFGRGMNRDDCLKWIAQRGYPTPPRSACIGCPFRSNKEWAALNQEELADACEVDRLIREGDEQRIRGKRDLVGQPYLHRKMVPLVEIDFSNAPENNMTWNDECSGICGV